MESLKGWLSINFKSCMLVKVFRHKAKGMANKKGNKQGLVSLYKDMEACAGYADIQVMWEMLNASCPPNSAQNNSRGNRSSRWRFCFRPT